MRVFVAGATGVIGRALVPALVHTGHEVVVHALTDLSQGYVQLRKGTGSTNRLRSEGTRNLVEAARAAGARRFVAESIAFLYAPEGDLVKNEQARPPVDRCLGNVRRNHRRTARARADRHADTTD